MQNEVFSGFEGLVDVEVVKKMREWSIAQPYLQYIHETTHGWERWAQIDIFLYLRTHGFHPFVEQYVYADTAQRLDLWVHLGNTTRSDCFELKAWSEADALPVFMDAVKSDVAKFVRNTQFPADKNGTAWAVGFLPWASILKVPNPNAPHALYEGPKQQVLSKPEERQLWQKPWAETVLEPYTSTWFDDEGHPYKRFVFVDAGHLILMYWRAEIKQGQLVLAST